MVHLLSQSVVTLLSQLGHIDGFFHDVGAFQDLVGGIQDLHFAGPLALVTGHADVGAGNQQSSFFLGAGYVVDVVSTLFVLGVQLDLAVPPGLGSLDVGVHVDLGVHGSSDELSVAHGNVLGLGGLISGLVGGSGLNGLILYGLIIHNGIVHNGCVGGLVAASDQADNHNQGQQHSDQFFHNRFLLLLVLLLTAECRSEITRLLLYNEKNENQWVFLTFLVLKYCSAT